MKTGSSTLNPYAESYVPISKRAGPNGKHGVKYAGSESKSANEGSVLGTQQWDPTSRGPQSYNIHSFDSFYTAEDSKLKGHSGYGFHGSSSNNAADISEKGTQDEDFDMDMAYLQMTFPGIADESLSEVYLANNGDLDSTVDMLNHLELSVDSSQKLPDTLDIGDVPELGSASELASQKLKNVNIESGASSSGLSGTAPVV